MKKILVVLLAVLLVVGATLGLVSCKKKHKFAETWTYNETQHWHECTVHDDCGEIADAANHILDPNGKCVVCDYKEHRHEFVWEYDENTHRQVATCHKVTEKEGPHAFGPDGMCECGLDKSFVDVYPVYKAFAAAKGEESDAFLGWMNALVEAGDKVELTADGDGKIVHADGSSEVEYFATRTAQIFAIYGANPLANVWVKVSYEDQVLGVAKTGADGSASVVFTPVAGFAEYVIELASEDDNITGTPYPGNFKIVEASAKTFEVSEGSVSIEVDGEFSFKKVLGVGPMLGLTHAQYGDGSYGQTYTSIELGKVPAGMYQAHLYNFAKSDDSNDEYFLISNGSITAKVGNEIFDCYIVVPEGTADVAVHIEQGKTCDLYFNLYIPEGTESIGFADGTTSYPRYADITLTALSNKIVLGENEVISSYEKSSSSGEDSAPVVLDVSDLPRGIYKMTGTMHGKYNQGTYDKSTGRTTVRVLGDNEASYTAVSTSTNTTNSNIRQRYESITYFELKEGDNELAIYGGYKIYHPYKFTLTSIEEESKGEIVIGENLNITFTERSYVYKINFPTGGKYQITVKGTGASSVSVLYHLVNVFAGATSSSGGAYIAQFEAEAGEEYIMLSCGTSRAYDIIIDKIDQSEITVNEELPLAYSAAVKSGEYTFVPSESGLYVLTISSESSLENLIVTVSGASIKRYNDNTLIMAVLSLEADSEASIVIAAGGNEISGVLKVSHEDAQAVPFAEVSNVTLSSSNRAAWYLLSSRNLEMSLVLSLEGELENVEMYYNGSLSAATASKIFEAVNQQGVNFLLLYSGSEEVQIGAKAQQTLPAPAIKAADLQKGYIKWNAVEGAEKYEVWFYLSGGEYHKADDVEVVDGQEEYIYYLHGEQLEKSGTHYYKVIAVADGYASRESAEISIYQSTDSNYANVFVNVTIPEEYPEETLKVKLGGTTITANKAESGETKVTLVFYGLESNFSGQAITITGINPLYHINSVTVDLDEEHTAEVEVVVEKNTTSKITVTVKYPAKSVMTFASFSLKMVKDGVAVPAYASKTVFSGDIEGKASYVWEVDATAVGTYSVSLFSDISGFSMEAGEVKVEELGMPYSIDLEIKTHENELTVTLPNTFVGNLVADIFGEDKNEALQSVSELVALKDSVTLKFLGLPAGSYTIELSGWTRPEQYLVNEEITLVVADDFSGSASATIVESPHTSFYLTVSDEVKGIASINILSYNLALYKADAPEVAVATATISNLSKSGQNEAKFYVLDDVAGSYIVKADVYNALGNNKYILSLAAFSKEVTLEGGQIVGDNSVVLNIAEEHWVVNFTVDGDGMNGKALRLQFAAGSMGNSVLVSDFSVNISNRAGKLYLFNLTTSGQYAGKYQLQAKSNTPFPEGYSLDPVKLDYNTKEYTVALNVPLTGIDLTIKASVNGFTTNPNNYVDFFFAVFEAESGKQIGKEAQWDSFATAMRSTLIVPEDIVDNPTKYVVKVTRGERLSAAYSSSKYTWEAQPIVYDPSSGTASCDVTVNFAG